MREKEFNLLQEPWIRVLKPDLEIAEVSLTDALIHAHEYTALAGEMPTQDFALLRLLLACVQTIFYRYDADGGECLLSKEGGSDETDVLERWEEYWDRGCFDAEVIRSYFAPYSERFWLFHPQSPFYQVAGLEYGTDYGVSCLCADLKSSNNPATKFHFSMREGEGLRKMSYAQSARWLLHLNAYGVNVKNDKKAPGTTDPAGTGRLGKLGLIYVDGDSLYRQLLLNLTPLFERELWEEPRPVWERPVRTRQSIQIAPPDNLPELYTLQSRRILLKREEGFVTGFRAMNGDYYPYEDDFHEQMTLWNGREDKKTKRIVYEPRRHQPQVQAWREFPVMFNTVEGGRLPGVVQWMQTLAEYESDAAFSLITFRTVGILYGDKMSYTYGECLSDGITLSADLLRSFSRVWMSLITDEIVKCVHLVQEAIRPFAQQVTSVLRGADAKGLQERLTESFYGMLDVSFRDWLAGIRPDTDRREDAAAAWEHTAYRCAVQVVWEYLEKLKNDFYLVRVQDQGKSVSIPEAYMRYTRTAARIFPQITQEKTEEVP